MGSIEIFADSLQAYCKHANGIRGTREYEAASSCIPLISFELGFLTGDYNLVRGAIELGITEVEQNIALNCLEERVGVLVLHHRPIEKDEGYFDWQKWRFESITRGMISDDFTNYTERYIANVNSTGLDLYTNEALDSGCIRFDVGGVTVEGFAHNRHSFGLSHLMRHKWRVSFDEEKESYFVGLLQGRSLDLDG